MGFANNVVPFVRCPKCQKAYLLSLGCDDCVLTHGEATVTMDPSLCLCDAEQHVPDKIGPEKWQQPWNIIHELRPTCPPDRGLGG